MKSKAGSLQERGSYASVSPWLGDELVLVFRKPA